MANPMQVMWYINPNDGPFPWSPDGRFPADLMRSRGLAVALDRRGFFGSKPFSQANDWLKAKGQPAIDW